MKLLALILSFYVIALTAIPCSDFRAVDTESISIENIQESGDHSVEIDLCSPFCFCNCCQMLDQPDLHSFSQIDFFTNKLFVPNLVQNEKTILILFWRPPKFV